LSAAPATQRADARRNHDRIVEAAIEAFREQGLDVGVAEIARRANVGSGTLFRNFPTKADLIDAVVTLHMDRWVELISNALGAGDAARAFDALLIDAIGFNYVDHGMIEAAMTSELNPDNAERRKSRVFAVVEQLLARARAAGALREGITPGDIHALVMGAAESVRIAVRENDEDPQLAQARFGEILLRGLRP
jgi:AcrR family transcriptional regulator